MKEYEVSNFGQTFFVPKFAVDAFLPEFVAGLESYLAEQAKAQPQRQQSAYKVLSKVGLDNADQWLAALLVAPLISHDDGYVTTDLGISGFTKYYATYWDLFNPERPRDGFEAVLRLIRVFFDTTGLVDKRTDRPRGQVEQLVVFELTELGHKVYPGLEIEVADEPHSKTIEPSDEPIEYMSAPWLTTVDYKHIERQSEEVERRLANQASAASSVGYVIPKQIADVYCDWFPLSRLPVKAESKLDLYLKRKERHKIVNVRRMQKCRREAVQELADEIRYYPVAFDRKGRQYMLGYPLSPQGAKVDRPLFYMVADGVVDKDKALASLNMEGKDAFGDRWEEAKQLTLEQLNNHNDPYVMEVCSTKGTQDLHKYTILLERAKYEALQT